MLKDIAVVVCNNIQLLNIKPGIDALIKKGYKIDFFYPNYEDFNGFTDMFKDIKNILIANNYSIGVEGKNSYKVLLEPYKSFLNIDYKYKIKYKYSNLSAKPNVVYKPREYIEYDAILCSGEYDANFLSVFSQTYQIGNMKYIDFKKSKKRPTSKKTLLYLPTYGEYSSLDLIGDEIKKLRKDYYIICKIHHGSQFLTNEQERKNKIKELVDEFYDSSKELETLLAEADVVLTDNSGSIFEALYTFVPVAVFCQDINANKLQDFDATQYLLYKQKVLPYTNKLEEIKTILKQALSTKYIEAQKKWSEQNFYHPKSMTNDFVTIMENYINDKVDTRYISMHKILINDYLSTCDNEIQLMSKNKELSEELVKKDNEKINLLEEAKKTKEKFRKTKKQLKDKIASMEETKIKQLEYIEQLEKQLEYFKNGKLYKIAKKIYEMKNGD